MSVGCSSSAISMASAPLEADPQTVKPSSSQFSFRMMTSMTSCSSSTIRTEYIFMCVLLL